MLLLTCCLKLYLPASPWLMGTLLIFLKWTLLEMASKTEWARGKIFQQHKTCKLLKRPAKQTLFWLTGKSCSNVSEVTWSNTMGTNGSSDCHRHTCGLLWFHTFSVLLHLNLYSNKTNSINKKDQLFHKKKKRKCNDYNIRTGKKQLNSYISLTNSLFLKKIPTIFFLCTFVTHSVMMVL